MNQFIVKIVVYLSIIIASAYCLGYVIDNGLKKVDNNIYGDWNRLFNGEIKDDIIIIGNSRAKVHFDPKIIEEQTGLTCYNLGKDATDLFQHQTVLNSLINSKAKPQFIILSIDINSLPKKNEIFEKEAYLPFLEKRYIYSILSEIDSKIWFEKNIPLIKYRGFYDSIMKGLTAQFKPIKKYTKYKGYQSQNIMWNDDFDTFKKSMGNTKIVLNSKEVSNGLKYLKTIINDCVKSNIKLILVQTPRYFEIYDFFPQKDSVDMLFERIAKIHNIPYIDFSQDSLCYKKNLFYNASHLNAKGASEFTTIFSATLDSLIKPTLTSVKLK